ncbi:MAG: pyridoxamine 5'-phosphate oxidase family protein [Acidimicrobiales bacterium]
MRPLSRSECLDYLRRVPVGRIGVSIDALPVILPVQFTLFGESVLFRTIPGTKLDTATIGAVVAFQADAFEPSAGSFWSVMLQGIPTEVDREAEPLAAAVPVPGWDPFEPGHRLVRLDVATVIGSLFLVDSEELA